MKVLIDATPAIHGERAIRKYSRNLVTHLLTSGSGIEYVMFYIDWRNNTKLRIPLPDGGQHREYTLRIPGRLMEWCWNEYSLPKIESLVGKIDLVYGTDLVFPPARRAITLCTLHGIACMAVPDLITPSHNVALRHALNYALKESDYFLAVSEHTKGEAINFLRIPEDRVKVFSFGVDPNMQQIEDHSLVTRVLKERFGVERPYILFVGAILHRKNILRLLEAFSLIMPQVPDLSLVLAGPPENAYESAMAFIERANLKTRVRFLGLVPPDSDDMAYLYNGAELLLYPTLHEGWTSPPLEAMACGIPVVTSDYSSVPETCGGAAHLVDPLDVGSIAAGTIKVLQDEDLRRVLVDHGFRRVEECQWSNCAKRLESIFQELVSSGVRRI